MKKPHRAHEPHLAVRESSIAPGGEWTPGLTGWSLIQAEEGTGYCLQPDVNRELETGAVLLVAGETQVTIRASQLSRLSLHSFSVVPRRLGGLLTLNEQTAFQTAASRKEFSFQILPPRHPVAIKMKDLCASRNQVGLLFRLKVLQLFVEIFGNELDQPAPSGAVSDATDRLRIFLNETPSSELLERSLNELASRTRCTPRHLGRIFRELVGVSFRDMRADARLARARELLATSQYKVVEVALESGFNSLSLFNLMFTRRYGTTPGRWRQKNGNNGGGENRRNKRTQQFAICAG